MKQLFLLLFALVATTSLWAYDFQSGDLSYTITSNSAPYTVEVTDAVSSITTAIIPENVTYDGTTYSVTSIGDNAFYNCSSLTSITIPNSVTRIGSSAFSGCSSLTSITIPNSVTSIGSSAFYGTGIYNDESNWENDVLYIDNCLIKARTSISGAYTINENARLIANSAFSECSGLTSITIPNSVTSIGGYAFARCYSLTSITIPNSVTSIGKGAFYHCSRLTSITIPNSVTSIGSSAFEDCSSLTKTNYTGDVASWCNIKFGDSYANPMCKSHNFYINDVEIKDLVIPNSVDSIHNDAFYECNSLTSITIPNSVTSIGEYAFNLCAFTKDNFTNNSTLDAEKNSYWGARVGDTEINGLLIKNDTILVACRPHLISITIPNGVTSIGDSAFYEYSSLTSITIPNSVTSIGSSAFRRCSSLTSVTIPNSVTSIGEYAFSGCYGLRSVTIGNSVTSIGDRAFYGCYGLHSVTIGNSVTSIGVSAFYNTGIYNNQSNWENNVLYIDNCLIEARSISGAYTINENARLIATYAFSGCSSLTSITIPNSVTSIGNWAFRGCSSLTSVTIPNSVTSIGEYAFSGCYGLRSVTIPNSVTSIGEEAFGDCKSLAFIYLPYDIPIVDIQSSFDGSHFEEVKLYVPFESYENYKNDSIWSLFKNILYIDNFYENNVRYRYIMDGEILSASLLIEENFKLFSTISIIGSQNWYYDSKYGATMNGYQNNVTHQNEDWLISPALDLSKHSSATLTFSHAFGPKASVPSTADQKAQYTCWISNDFNGDVATATWTELPITYGTSAWSYITTTVDIPAENLKENCHIAWKYVCTTSSATWEIKSVEIGGSYTRPVVKVIAKNDKYSNDVVIPSVVTHNYADYSVEIIAASAFSSCPSLTSITIGNNVKSIENYAFESCSSLTSVMLGGKIETIGENAFSGCTALNEITLPTSVKSIGENAFAGCTKLYDIYCFAMEPPTAYESSFANYNAFLHVPCDNQRVYLLDVIFGNFKFIECIEAETTPTDTVVVTPSFNDAEFIWPSNSSADSYTLAISKDGEVFCTLTFNANGQLTGIAFAPSRNGQHNAPAAAQTANGFAFTVTGLDEGVNYTYNLLVQDRSGNTLQSYSGKFTTQSTTAVENTHSQSPMTNCQKLLRNGQLIILRDGVEYNAMGVRL